MKFLPIVLLIIALPLIGVYLYMNKTSVQETPDHIATMETNDDGTPVREALTVLITQNDSGESGTAILKEKNGAITVELSMQGFQNGVQQPAHIHTGTCENIGGVEYPLTNVVDGVSSTDLDITIDDLKASLPLAINVHKSVSESNVYTACGNLFSE